MSKKQRAFTLVELLVVIGIIALLIGILLPALSRARDAANSAKCLANMRLAATAVAFYLNDSKGRWIPAYKFPESSPNYIPTGTPNYNGAPFYYTWLSAHYFKGGPSMWICPSDYLTITDPTARQLRLYTSDKDSICSYFYNLDLPKSSVPIYPEPYRHAAYFNPRPLKYVKNATKLILYGESTQGTMLSYRSSTTGVARLRWDHRKNNAMSICFADGHAEQLDKSELLLRTGETTGGPARIREYWYGSPAYAVPFDPDNPGTFPS